MHSQISRSAHSPHRQSCAETIGTPVNKSSKIYSMKDGIDFIEKMNAALDYIENHLDDDIDYTELAREAGCTEYHFSRMFSFITGQNLSLYIRRRRLSNAAIDLAADKPGILDIAVKYGYSSVDAFSRAFKDVHEILPSQVKKNPSTVKVYPRIIFNLSITGGQEMKYRIVEKESFRIVGIKKHVDLVFHGVNPEIAAMWESLTSKEIARWKTLSNTDPKGIISASTNFSEDRMTGKGSLDHYIGAATTSRIETDDSCLEVQAGLWAVFESLGKFPDTLQNIWGRIYSEWFPAVPYEVAPGPEMLWNEQPDTSDPDFKSEIWIPIRFTSKR